MSFDFSTLITDRSSFDLETLRDLLATPMEDWTSEKLAEFNLARSKGAYNYTDLNRVTECMDYLASVFQGLGYDSGYTPVVVNQPGAKWPLPDGYTMLEYVQSSGVQYVDLQYPVSADMSFSCVFQPTQLPDDTNVVLVGGTAVSFRYLGTLGVFAYYIGGSSARFSNALSTLGSHQLTLTTTQCSLDGNQLNAPATADEADSFFLFAYRGASGSPSLYFPAKVSSLSINGNALIPCMAENGDVGFYDTFKQEFIHSQGSEPLSAGPSIPKPEEKDPYTWYMDSDNIRFSTLEGYRLNVQRLRNVITLAQNTPEVPASMALLNYVGANNIEQILVTINNSLLRMEQTFVACGPATCGGDYL